MIKKLFVKFSMLLILLGMSVNAAWAQEETPDGQTVYLVAFKTQASPESTGSGIVKLTWIDAQGKLFDNALLTFLNDPNVPDQYRMPYATGNPSNGNAFSEDAMVVGATLFATESLEESNPKSMANQVIRNMFVQMKVDTSHVFVTPFAYYKADAQGANGSYFDRWTFNDAKITRQDTAMDKTSPQSAYFKVLPNSKNVFYMAPPSTTTYLSEAYTGAVSAPNMVYAVFNKYLLSNPVSTSASVDAVADAEAHLTVTVDINGEAASLDAADFGSFTFTNNGSSEWAYDLAAALASKEVVSDQKTRITIPVTYTYKNTGFGLKNTTMTISMAGVSPSSLNINLSVNALDPGRAEAYWFDGKVEKTSGYLSDMLEQDISTYANPILKLNKPVSTNLTFAGKNFTLDLNGNETQAITVSSGNVTFAYSKFGGTAASLTVNGGKAILNGGTFGSLTIGANGTVEQNGATITGAATNAGSLTTTEGSFNAGLTSSKTLVLNGGTFKGDTAVIVSSGTATINRGAIEGTNCGLKVTGGEATVKKLAAIKGGTYSAQRTGGTLIVECGKFDGPLNGTINFTSGYFKTNNYGVSTEGKNEMLVSTGVEYNEGYRYFLGTAESAVANGAGVCRIGNVSYAKLEDAIAYANNNPGVANIVIFMTNNYTLPAGYYTLPANATIVVPMSDSQEKEINMTAPRIIFNDVNNTTPYVNILPTEFRRLTFASGVNMDVFGQIELTCSQYASNEAYTAQPCGAYGRLVLEEGSHLTLQSGSEVRAWGFVTGKGEMDARRGAKVREMFQLGDWKGAFTSVEITGMAPGIVADHSEKKIFPVTQYFIQNIESPVKYHPGAVLSTSAAVSEGLMGMSVSMAATDIAIVGVSGQHQAIFLMDQMADAENTWVRKWYDAENDIQVYDINSAAHIGSMVLDMGTIALMGMTVPVRLNSAKFDLPLTCNFKIHLLSGTMDFQQNTSLLPGAEVEVDKESTVTVAMDDTEKAAYEAWVAGGKSGDAPVCYTGALYVYDADEWDKYAFCGNVKSPEDPAYTKTVRYAASWNGRPTVRNEQVCPPDAAINIHGTFKTATGFVYCSEHGANIFSNNEDAGTFVFNEDAADAGERTVYNVKGSGTFEDMTFYPAKLKNGVADPQFANTSTAVNGDAYCYTDDKWNIFEAAGCFMKDDYDTYYAKPQEYVALANGMTPNSDHTFSDAAGAGRLFILQGDCQWWEVEKKGNLYHCIHPDNDTYYYWGYDADEDRECWLEKRFTITWKNWDGTEIISYDHSGGEDNLTPIDYSVTYGTMAEFLGTNPTREKTIDYTYDFTGWSPALGPVTSDVTYTATFTQKQRKYTIIFQQEGGLEIERQFLTHNEVPVCENVPTKVGHTLVWSPAVAAVTRDATYTATWEENPPTEYQITFYDYNGTSVLKQGNVNVGDMPVPPAQVNTRPATSEFTYVFDHWSPAVEKVSATSIKSYTAVYREVAKTFPVNFYFGSKSAENQIGATQFLEIGQDPVIPNDERLQKTEDNANVYQLVWTPQIQTVIGHEDDYTYEYVASYTSTPKQYSLTLKCTPSGAAVITGARADYAYGAKPTITVKANTGYNFVSWSDGEPIGDPDEDGVYSREVTINDNIELTVVCECPDCDKSTIIWKNEAGDAELATDLVPVGSATIYHGATPTKKNSLDGQYSYTFYGWTTRDNEGHDIDTFKNSMTPKVAAVENPTEQTYTYYACFTPVVRQYNVSLSSNIENVCILVGAGTYDYSVTNNATVIVSGYDAANYTFNGWYKGEEQQSTAESYSFPVQSNVNLVAKFTPKKYTIIWKNENGSTLETDANQAYGAATAFNGAEPTKDGYSFIGWTTAANGEGSFYAKGATPAISGNANYYACYAENSRGLEIGAIGSETLTEATDYTTFTITSNGETSGQLIGANYLSLLGEAIFKLQPESAISARTWYAVAAPWQVDVRTGIYAGGTHLNVGRDFDIIEFNAESYAVNEAGEGNKNIWRYVEENGGVMQPGKLYLIYLASPQTSLEFHKTGGGILTTSLSVTTTSGSGSKANWNAIANPALYHADLGLSGTPDVLQYIDGGYTPTSATNLIVGQPIFAQVATPQSTVAASMAAGEAPAPYRRAASASADPENRFVVEIALNGKMNDRIIIQTAEEKANEYVIGQDLAKMGVGTKAAQMWMERYDSKLCKNTMEMTNDRAEYPLSIYAPAAGEYTISAVQQRGNETLYLTRDGEAIWNLSDGDYTIPLSRGTTADYGLRVSARTPQIATGCDEVIADGAEKAQKVLVKDQIFIIRGEKVYTIDGQLVK